MIVSDNTIQTEVLGSFFKNLLQKHLLKRVKNNN